MLKTLFLLFLVSINITLFSQNNPGYINIAKAYVDIAMPDSAIAKLKKSKNPQAHIMLAKLLFEYGKWDDAKEILNTSPEKTKD
ncbi:MAG: hypothetical protein C0594_07820, partial [Marinilabiliales bacterium]